MLKAILFDLDGTLIDSEHFYFESWNEILAEVGAQFTFNDWLDNYVGSTVYLNAQRLKDKYNIPGTVNELIARRKQLTIDRFKTTDVSLMPYVRESLQFYRGKGLRICIATSSQREDVEAIFERNGLGHFFEFMITRTDVTNGKPHPESYLRCVERLGIAKDECIVFEDTNTGISAAKAAGLTCYAIHGNVAEHPKLAAADMIFVDLNHAREHLIKMQVF